MALPGVMYAIYQLQGLDARLSRGILNHKFLGPGETLIGRSLSRRHKNGGLRACACYSTYGDIILGPVSAVFGTGEVFHLETGSTSQCQSADNPTCQSPLKQGDLRRRKSLL